jgi:hypothetical protein
VVEILTEAANQARIALSRRTVVEVALLKAARAATMVSLDELIAQIQVRSGGRRRAGVARRPPHPSGARGGASAGDPVQEASRRGTTSWGI